MNTGMVIPIKNMLKAEKINLSIYNVTRQAILAAIKYEKVTGRKLGITGEVGEILVCRELGLKLLSNPIAAGFDAIDDNSKKYQIKTRRGNTNSPGARIGTFAKYRFDYAILAILDHEYNIIELYKTTFKKLEPILQRYEKRNPPIRQFKNIATDARVKIKK